MKVLQFTVYSHIRLYSRIYWVDWNLDFFISWGKRHRHSDKSERRVFLTKSGEKSLSRILSRTFSSTAKYF